MTRQEPASAGLLTDDLPRWDVTDLHESFTARSFLDALDRLRADAGRLEALFDEHGIRAVEPRPVTSADGQAADAVIAAFNEAAAAADIESAYVYATVATDSYHDHAQALLTELTALEARQRPLLARLAAWVAALGVDALAAVSHEVGEHVGPLRRLAARAQHQMTEAEEHLYATLRLTGSSAWDRLHADVTSQLSAVVQLPDGSMPELPIAAVRSLSTSPDPAVRRAAYDAEMRAWPTVTTPCAAALNAVKGESCAVNERRRWATPVAASLFANSVQPATFEAMQDAVVRSLPDLRRWMRAKARLHGYDGGLRWWDLDAPLPHVTGSVAWADGMATVRSAFASYSPRLAGMLDQALDQRWIDAGARPGKQGGAFCMGFIDDRSLILMNWSGSADSTQTAAHELGHAYHNTQLHRRTMLQRALPMTLAETASIFCETITVEAGLAAAQGQQRLALLDVDLVGASQVIVDIHSRFLFESAVFERRRHTTLGVAELNELMLAAQLEAYGDGLDQTTAHPYMWAVKSHYYGSSFYNWPYTFGMLFGIGLYAQYRDDPERFRLVYDDALSRAGMDQAEELAVLFGFDITDVGFWDASLDVVRGRIEQYCELAGG
ncbi:MAG: M3 family oligoendopeptidase [Ilumatobacteraceae bacterium]